MSGFELIGLGLSAASSIIGGIAANNEAKAQAAAAERQANEERAASQREAITRAREARVMLSRQQAVSAASGGGATDSTVTDLMGKTAQQGQFNTASAIYEGEARGRGLEDQAAISRMRGKNAMLGGFIGAGTTVLDGMSKMKMPSFTSIKRQPLYGGKTDPWAGLRM